jgi:hypothetical protein
MGTGPSQHGAEPSSPYDLRSRQFGPAPAPIMPQAEHAMRGPNPAKACGRASDRRSAPLRGGRTVGRGSARANGLARDRHVVGVHDAMNKADKQPLRDKVCLARNHLVKKGDRVRGAFRPWVMPRDDVISEAPDRIHIATRCENRKVPTRTWLDATRVRTAPGKAVLRQTGSPVVTAASAPVVGIPSAANSFADNVFTPHRPKRRTSVATTRIRRRARLLELDVAAHTGAVDDLAEKDGFYPSRYFILVQSSQPGTFSSNFYLFDSIFPVGTWCV